MTKGHPVFWATKPDELIRRLGTTNDGLTNEEAKLRLFKYGYNLPRPRRRPNDALLLLSQFKSPIVIMLIFAATLSFFLRDPTGAEIILIIILASGLLTFWQERGANQSVDRLLAMVRVSSTVVRDGAPIEIPIEEIVPGDVALLNAGDMVPGDCIVLESRDLFVNEAFLTGETFPVEKTLELSSPEATIRQRNNALFMGTNIVSGTAKALAVQTGTKTELGKIGGRLALRPPETEFEKGIRHFGYFLMEITFLMLIAVFVINVYFARPVLESLLFALALAVGLTPQLLPAIVSINLAHGARRMASEKVIVKRLASIENFGSMNILCTDKTGTLTEGTVKVRSIVDVDGRADDRVLQFAYLNATLQSGFKNPIDEGIRNFDQTNIIDCTKLDEVPYDFVRKRLSILVSFSGRHVIVTKGAVPSVLSVCSSAQTSSGEIVGLETVRSKIEEQFSSQSEQGYRVLGVAIRDVGRRSYIERKDEDKMTFVGFVVLFDAIRPRVIKTLNRLNTLGISLKIITGDNRLVAANVAQQVGLSNARVVTGADFHGMSEQALVNLVRDVDIYAEIEPNQKERIIFALKKAGNVVGFLGDGINDATALHAADVGISVDTAVDVAKEAADIILLERDLAALVRGVEEGRRTFANTMKYVFMATSANFGNMFSMAGVSLFLPFLPMLPRQVLLNNLLTDLPEMAIAADTTDQELVKTPHRWDVGSIRKFMLVFGTLSSVYDYATFGVLLLLLNATVPQFRTGWFLESVLSASLIVLVIRTRRPSIKSKPGKHLVAATLLVAAVTLVLPFTVVGKIFEFETLPPSFFWIIVVVLIVYVLSTEATKHFYYRRIQFK